MKILFVQSPLCIRTMKEAVALIDAGHKVLLFTDYTVSMKARVEIELYKLPVEWMSFVDYHAVVNRVLELSKEFDIIHVANEPNWHIPEFRRVIGHNYPIVWDMHDVPSRRFKKHIPLEEESVRNASAVVCPSEGIVKYVQDHYSYHAPTLALPPFPAKRMLPDQSLRHPKTEGYHAVYEGGITPIVPGVDLSTRLHVHVRDFYDIFKHCIMAGVHVHVFSGRKTLWKDPRYVLLHETGKFHFYERVSYKQLIVELTRFTAGIAPLMVEKVSGAHRENCGHALSNKSLDYMCAGIPVIAYGCKSVQDFVVSHETGIAVNDWHDIPTVIKDGLDRPFKLKDRTPFLMDTHIHKLVELYTQLRS